MTTNFYPRLRLNFLFLLKLMLLTGISGLNAQTTDSTIFRDDFNRPELGDAWQADPSWSILDGSAYNFIDGVGGTLKTTESFSDSSYIIVTAAMGFKYNYNRAFRITFGQADLSNSELYQVRYTADYGARLTLARSSDNVYFPEVLDQVPVFPALSVSTWYRLKIERYKSGLIQVYLDKGLGFDTIPVLEAIDSTYATLGHLGWQVDTESFAEDFFVDWIAARKPAIEKPAILEKPTPDDLITLVFPKNGKAYKVAKLIPGVKQLIDRDYTITSVPQYLTGASFIQTANDDKFNTEEDFLTFFASEAAIIYVGFDSRSTAIPGWLQSWTKTGDVIGTSDSVYLDVYSKVANGTFFLYRTTLGGNLAFPASGAQTHYLVAAVRKPKIDALQAEDALLSGAIVENNHQNYTGTGFVNFINPSDDYIEWTVQINVPGIYSLGFSFANASYQQRSLQVTDNGIPVGIATFPAISTSWSSWAFHGGPQVFLSPGEHKLRLTAIGTSGPNVDKLSLFYASNAISIASATPPITLLRNALPATAVPGKAVESLRAYPNPFLQHTNIYYTLKQKSKVVLSVYSLQGQQIQILVNGTRDAGNYQATFEAGKLAKGVYIYRLQVGNEIKTGKLVKN